MPHVPRGPFLAVYDRIHVFIIFLHFLHTLNSADVWMRILRCEYPSMAAPGVFLAPRQRHQLFRRTAKQLLSIRITDDYYEFSEAQENEFRNECVRI